MISPKDIVHAYQRHNYRPIPYDYMNVREKRACVLGINYIDKFGVPENSNKYDVIMEGLGLTEIFECGVSDGFSGFENHRIIDGSYADGFEYGRACRKVLLDSGFDM